MRHPLLMPKLGLTMTEGLLSAWRVDTGQQFKAGDTLYVVETDKVSNEVAAEDDGVLLDVLVPAGETVPCGEVLGHWEGIRIGDRQGAGTDAAVHAAVAQFPSAGVPGTRSTGSRLIASPLARRVAAQRGIELSGLQGSGPRGRIVLKDVERALSASAGAALPVPDRVTPTAASAPPAASFRLLKPSGVQATAARRLTLGKQETPHFYLALEAQVGRLMAMRAELKNGVAGSRLTLNHFILAAVARALREMPQANRVWRDDGIVEFESADIGVAVATERGLMAPLLRDVANLRLTELARRADALVERARAGSLSGDDFEGGSITVSNAGMHNVTYMTSIINPGQAMILGVGSIREVFRPDDLGQPKLCRELGLVLSVDHRVTDGVGALRFLNRIVDLLQRPARLLLD